MQKSFSELGLPANVLKAIQDLGFEHPSAIQEQAVPQLLANEGGDLVALAQTGTGKTAAFGLPLSALIDFDKSHTQALVLCPTRELCIQITKDLQQFTKYIPKANVVAVYGGASIINQMRDIQRGAQIIVATPGRMVDILNRRKVDISALDYAVLDEADEMLNMGFKEDLDTILSTTPEYKSTWLFSATMPKEVASIAKKFMTDPFEITVGSKNQGNTNIEHLYALVSPREKYPALKRIADFNPDIFGIVFCRTKRETQEVAEKLIKDGYNADAIHGDLSQSQRDNVMKRYRNHSLQLLVATDVAARGIDVNDVTHVIHYNLPDELESYTHRSGRTARAGKKGISIALVSKGESRKIATIEKIVKSKFALFSIPNGEEVIEKQLTAIVDKICDTEINAEVAPYLPRILEKVEGMSKDELVNKIISQEFSRLLSYYKNARDIEADSGPERSRRGDRERGRQDSGGVTKFFVNLGSKDGLEAETLKSYISETSRVEAKKITWVGLRDSYSFFEVFPEYASKIAVAFDGEVYGSRPVEVELRGDGGNSGFKRKRTRKGGGKGGDFGGNGGGSRKKFAKGGGSGGSRPRTGASRKVRY